MPTDTDRRFQQFRNPFPLATAAVATVRNYGTTERQNGNGKTETAARQRKDGRLETGHDELCISAQATCALHGLHEIVIHTYITRKPCYREDDRAMRRMPWTISKVPGYTPMATIPEIVNGLLVRWIA